MKAIRKSDGKIIEVEIYMLNNRRDKNGLWESSYKDNKSGIVYEASELEFNLNAEETVISGWVARDNGGFISLFSYLPDRVTKDNLGFWGHNDGSNEIDMPQDSFPDLTWDSEPKEVEIIIKPKKR